MVLIKMYRESIITPFTYSCIKSFEFGILHDSMKIAETIPVFVNGNKLYFDDHRPKAFIAQFRKNLDKIILKEIR